MKEAITQIVVTLLFCFCFVAVVFILAEVVDEVLGINAAVLFLMSMTVLFVSFASLIAWTIKEEE